jgi:hypothetical protein
MTIDRTKIIQILDYNAQKVQETTVDYNARPTVIQEDLLPYPRDHRGRITVDDEKYALAQQLREAGGQMSTANFPDALRMGLRMDLFTSYNETPVIWPQIARVVPSNKQQEEYKNDVAIGKLPVVAEGQPYPEIGIGDGAGKLIKNHKRGAIIVVTEEMQRFDQIGIVREQPELMGRSARLTEDQDTLDILTATGNYTSGTTNSIAANTAATTMSPEGLETAWNVLRFMNEGHSGTLLNVMPDTLVAGPRLEFYIRQLLFSTQVNGMGDKDATVVYGQGTQNPFFSMVRNIIISPYFGTSYQWALLEKGRAIYFQRVDNIDVRMESPATSDQYLERDVLRYRVRNWYGVGMRDDRFAYYSSSTTKPTIN